MSLRNEAKRLHLLILEKGRLTVTRGGSTFIWDLMFPLCPAVLSASSALLLRRFLSHTV